MPTLKHRIGIEVKALDEREHNALKVDMVKAMDKDLEACAFNAKPIQILKTRI